MSHDLECNCAALREEVTRLKEWNQDRAGRFACIEQRLSTDNAQLYADLAESRKFWQESLRAALRDKDQQIERLRVDLAAAEKNDAR